MESSLLSCPPLLRTFWWCTSVGVRLNCTMISTRAPRSFPTRSLESFKGWAKANPAVNIKINNRKRLFICSPLNANSAIDALCLKFFLILTPDSYFQAFCRATVAPHGTPFCGPDSIETLCCAVPPRRRISPYCGTLRRKDRVAPDDGIFPHRRNPPYGRGVGKDIDSACLRVIHSRRRQGRAARQIRVVQCCPGVQITSPNCEDIVLAGVANTCCRVCGYTGGWKVLRGCLHQPRLDLIGSEAGVLLQQKGRRTADHRRGHTGATQFVVAR